jgi:hypothetical protein
VTLGGLLGLYKWKYACVNVLNGDSHTWTCINWAVYIDQIDPFVEPKVVELPSELAKRVTFEEQVTDININRLQEVVNQWLYLTIPVMMSAI